MLFKSFLMVLSVFAGSMVAFQAPINAKLGSLTQGPLLAAFISFAVGTVALGFLVLVTGNLPKMDDLMRTDLWMWVGGLLGAIFVFTSITVVPVLGSALMLSLFILGQLIGALVIDKTGFLLPMSIDISWERMVAFGLILGGVVLFMRSV